MDFQYLTAAQAIQIGHFAKRGGVERVGLDISPNFVELCLEDCDGKTLGFVFINTDGTITSDSQAS